MSQKTNVTLHISQEALDGVPIHGYATQYALGDFPSQLFPDYQQQSQASGLTPSLDEWRQFVDEAEQLLSSEAGK